MYGINFFFSIQKKKKKIAEGLSFVKNPNFREDSLVFSDYFSQWKKEVDIFESPHPYKQFAKRKENVAEGEESPRPYKQFTKRKENVSEGEEENSDPKRIAWNKERERGNSKRSAKLTGRKFEEDDDDDDFFIPDQEENSRTTPMKSDRKAGKVFKKMEPKEKESTRTTSVFTDEDDDDTAINEKECSFNSNHEENWRNTRMKSDRKAGITFKKMKPKEKKTTRTTATFTNEDDDDIVNSEEDCFQSR